MKPLAALLRRLITSLVLQLGGAFARSPRPRPASPPAALWQLCSYEAGLLGALGGACSAFERPEAELLEWMEDVRLYETQGPGADINSRCPARTGFGVRAPLGSAAWHQATSSALLHTSNKRAANVHWISSAVSRFNRVPHASPPHLPLPLRIAGVLLADLGASLRGAAQASAAGKEPLQLARLHFA